MLYAYQQYLMTCEKAGIPAKSLNAAQTASLIELLQNPPAFEEPILIELLETRVTDDAKALELKNNYLQAIAAGDLQCPIIGQQRARDLLG
jgi:aconitate hydratase 2/2-methylisocitrate dehydratase